MEFLPWTHFRPRQSSRRSLSRCQTQNWEEHSLNSWKSIPCNSLLHQVWCPGKAGKGTPGFLVSTCVYFIPTTWKSGMIYVFDGSGQTPGAWSVFHHPQNEGADADFRAVHPETSEKLGPMKFHSGPTFLPFPDTLPLKGPASLGLGHNNLCYSQESSPCLLPNDKLGWNFPKKNCEILIWLLWHLDGSEERQKGGKTPGYPHKSPSIQRLSQSPGSFPFPGVFRENGIFPTLQQHLRGTLRAPGNSEPFKLGSSRSSRVGGAGAASPGCVTGASPLCQPAEVTNCPSSSCWARAPCSKLFQLLTGFSGRENEPELSH